VKFSSRWLHYYDIVCTQNTLSQCRILPILSPLAKC